MSDSLSAAELRAAFDRVPAGTVGIEEEVMLLDPETLELAPRAAELLARLDGDPRFKLELPAAQLEITLGPRAEPGELEAELAQARADLLGAAARDFLLAGAGAHPFSSGVGVLNRSDAYAPTISRYGPVARRQLVFALQIHVAVGGAERSLAVYNALRSYLPLLAAVAANAPFYEGRDTGLASIRPMLCTLLPRQGVPPAIESWEQFAAALAWGARAQTIPDPGRWWWELRPHPRFGTLELRVPDTQSRVPEAGAVALLAVALVRRLAERFDAGEPLPAAPTWRIVENRFAAARHGLEGEMADLVSGEPRPTRAWWEELLSELAGDLHRAGGAPALARARALVAGGGGAVAQRRVAETEGVRAMTAWLAARFLDPCAG